MPERQESLPNLKNIERCSKKLAQFQKANNKGNYNVLYEYFRYYLKKLDFDKEVRLARELLTQNYPSKLKNKVIRDLSEQYDALTKLDLFFDPSTSYHRSLTYFGREIARFQKFYLETIALDNPSYAKNR